MKYISLSELEDGIRRITHMMKSPDINTIFVGTEAYTTGTTIYLPKMPPSMPEPVVDMLHELQVHENGHIHYTDFAKYKRDVQAVAEKLAGHPEVNHRTLASSSVNAIEDIRVDSLTFAEYPGARYIYAKGLHALVQERWSEKIFVDMHPLDAGLKVWLSYSYRRLMDKHGVHVFFNDPDSASYRKLSEAITLFQAKCPETHAVVHSAVRATPKSQASVRKMALSLSELLIQAYNRDKAAKPSPRIKPPSSKHSEMPSYEPDTSSYEPDTSSDEPDTPSDEPESQPINGLDIAKDLSDWARATKPDLDTASPDEQALVFRPEGIEYFVQHVDQPLMQGTPQAALDDANQMYDRMQRATRQVAELLKAHASCSTRPTSSGRRLLHKRLASIRTGNTNVFTDARRGRGYDTAVLLLIDRSASMYQSCLLTGAVTAAMAIQRMLSGVDVPLEILAFDSLGSRTELNAPARKRQAENTSGTKGDRVIVNRTNCRISVIKPFESNSTANLVSAFAWLLASSGGATPTTPALLHAEQRLAQRKERRKIMFVLQDGSPQETASVPTAPTRRGEARFLIAMRALLTEARRTVERMQRKGTEVYGLGIGIKPDSLLAVVLRFIHGKDCTAFCTDALDLDRELPLQISRLLLSR